MSSSSSSSSEPPCSQASSNHLVQSALDKYFKGAVSIQDLKKLLIDCFDNDSGIIRNKVLFGISSCPDEINRDLENGIDGFGRPFNLGGLSGLPFVGTAGYSAYDHHVADEGAILIIFSSHVGISPTGKVGHILRHGMCDESTSCGAAIGALDAAWRDLPSFPETVKNQQFVEIFNYVRRNISVFQAVDGTRGVGNAKPAIKDEGHVKLAKLISKKVEKDLLKIVEAVEAAETATPLETPVQSDESPSSSKKSKHKKVVIVGGIQINFEEPVAPGSNIFKPDYFLITHVSTRHIGDDKFLQPLKQKIVRNDIDDQLTRL